MGSKFEWAKIFIRGIAAILCMYVVVFHLGSATNSFTVIEDEMVPLSGWGKENVLYRHDGDGYCYVIVNDGREIFSFVDEDGTTLDVMYGGGTYMMVDSVTRKYNHVNYINGFTRNGDNGAIVSYQMSDGSIAYNEYKFYDNYVTVDAYISGISNSTTVAGAVLARSFANGCTSVEKMIASDWVYPANGDFPYQEQEGIVTAIQMGENHKLYTFVRGEDGKRLVLFEEYPNDHIPVNITNGVLQDYHITYDLVFENLQETSNADCSALFKSQGYEFSACVTEHTAKESAATIYFGNTVDLSIDVAGVGDADSSVQVSYSVYDYDGNIMSSAVQNVALQGTQVTSVPIHLETEKRGNFFLDYEVKSAENSHRELYSFALMDKYAYTMDNPFGVSGVRFGAYEQNLTTLWILQNIGAKNVRVCLGEPDYVSNDYYLMKTCLQALTGNGIKVNGQYLLMDGWVAPTAATAGAYESEINNVLSQVGQYLTDCQVGNEYNLLSTGDIAKGMSNYLSSYFNAGYSSIKETYGIDIGAAGVGLSQVNWMEQSVEAGLYDKQDVLVTHAYGYPHSPDYTNIPDIELCVESAYSRTKSFLEQAGDKKWYVGEVGYPTTALNTSGVCSGVDLRSQADYTVRECVLAVSYGADVVEVYNLYDQQNLFKGINAEKGEDNFGLFYEEDYYGRIMPKPSAIAFANMTRALDGVTACEEISVGSNTARVFLTESENTAKTVYVAWSNVARLSNDIGFEFKRTPNLPWNNQWSESELVAISVVGTSATVIDSMGNRREVAVENGQILVELTGSPIYIEVTKGE